MVMKIIEPDQNPRLDERPGGYGFPLVKDVCISQKDFEFAEVLGSLKNRAHHRKFLKVLQKVSPVTCTSFPQGLNDEPMVQASRCACQDEWAAGCSPDCRTH